MYSPKRRKPTLMPAIAMAALGAVVAIPALSQSHLYAASPQHFATVTVHPGESLWAIADRYTRGGDNVQDTMDGILAASGKTSTVVRPGERLRIPQ